MSACENQLSEGILICGLRMSRQLIVTLAMIAGLALMASAGRSTDSALASQEVGP